MAHSFPIVDVTGQTDVGLKRSKNEDSFTVVMPPAGSAQVGRGALFIVADGMGGMGGGDVASQTAIEEIVKQFYDPSVTQDYDPLPRLRTALEAANVRVRNTAQSVGLPRIGATGAGMVLTSTGDAVVFNVGDSRVYRARGSYIELLTRDQSVMASQLEAGLVTQEEARLSRNVNVTSFIGQPMTLSPVYSRMQTQPGDVFIICSDGLWDLVEPNELLKAVQAPSKSAARKLIAMVRQRGAPDNVTVIVVRIGKAPGSLPVPLIAGIAAALVVVVAAVALARSGAFGATASPTATEAATQTMTATTPPPGTAGVLAPSESVISMSVVTATPEVTALLVVSTKVPEQTAAVVAAQPTETSTATRRVTSTSTRTPSPAPTETPSATSTAMSSATSTSTRASTQTRTPTRAPTSEPSQTPSTVPEPTATEMHLPTVTVNPTLITYTPGPGPVRSATAPPVSAANHDEFILSVARTDDGVILRSGATLYLLDSATAEATAEATATAEVTLDPLSAIQTHVSFITTVAAATQGSPTEAMTAEAGTAVEVTATSEATVAVTAEALNGVQIPLDAGTHLRLIDDQPITPGSDPVDRLIRVTVTSGDHSGTNGWIRLSALLDAMPGAPYVLTSANVVRAVNVRSGEGLLSPAVAQLLPGQFARLLGLSTSPLGWYFIELPTGGRGWISPENVIVEGDRSSAKRLTPPPTPTFTPSPTDTPLPPPTLTPFGTG